MMGKFKGIMLKSLVKAVLFVALLGLILQILYPIRNTLIKLGILLFMVILWFCLLYLLYSKRKPRILFLGLTAAGFLFCCMPSRQINENKFRQQYVRSLSFYDSKPYMWGAENFLAVDCSGLIRQGYIDGSVIYGLKTFNGALVREAVLLWWYDSSAKAMRDEYRSQTKQITKAPSVNQLDHGKILPGDFAVTQNGAHCLAYLGEGRWIQADPTPNQVTISVVPTESSNWFKQPVYIMRWSALNR